jgi:hypothetical protein
LWYKIGWPKGDKNPANGIEEADKKRQIEIEKGGLKFLRYKSLPDDTILLSLGTAMPRQLAAG